MIGLDPEPFTLGRLVTMAESRRKEHWNHTAHCLAELMNGPRTRKDKQCWTAAEIDPYRRRHTSSTERVTSTEFVRQAIYSFL